MSAARQRLWADSQDGPIRYVAGVRADSPDVFVIGAGVSGLSTALVLLEAGMTVTVYAADPPQRTTSAVAGALWGAHLVGADQRVEHWAQVTLRRFRELYAEPAAGVRELRGLVASSGGTGPDPPTFARDAGGLVRCDPGDLPDSYTSGWRYTAPVVAMASYLDYLTDRLLHEGGQLLLGQQLRSLADALERTAAPVIVNCTAMGARELVPDPALTPVRGQVVVAANPGLTDFFVGEGADPDEVSYIFPHGATVVLGGTHERGAASLRPDPAAAERILASCTAVEPRLADVPVLAHRVGLRPVRPQVRLEAQHLPGGRQVVHNYGHGGAGVTLSWGCARAVLAEVTGQAGPSITAS
jgi:D-amino-acid oxidase